MKEDEKPKEIELEIVPKEGIKTPIYDDPFFVPGIKITHEHGIISFEKGERNLIENKKEIVHKKYECQNCRTKFWASFENVKCYHCRGTILKCIEEKKIL